MTDLILRVLAIVADLVIQETTLPAKVPPRRPPVTAPAEMEKPLDPNGGDASGHLVELERDRI